MDIQEARQSLPKRARSAVMDNDYFPLAGGLNVAETPMQLTPGELIGVLNYEPKTLGGYQRLQGYERYDGQLAPSQAQYWLMNFGSGVPANYPVVGNVVTGVTSGATGVVLVANVLNLPNTSGELILGRVTGTFVLTENLEVGSTVFGACTAVPVADSASDDTLDSTYTVAAREAQRALIAIVPGSGPVLGVTVYNGVVYAWRNNIEGSAAAMWKASGSSWVAVPPYPQLRFVAGGNQINAGDTIIGVTSTNTATVLRVVLQSGSWAAGTAQGFFILNAGAPAFVNGEVLNDTSIASATTSSTAVAPTILPFGKYDFCVNNFYGSTGTIRLYGCDGLNKAFEFQDSPQFLCPIETGMPVDAPLYIEQHRGRLWLAFNGGSVQPSGINDPTVYSALQGAAELGVGEYITGLLGEMSPSQSAFYSTATLFVFTNVATYTITGDGPNWIMGPFSVDTGAFPFSVQRLGQGMLLNDRGFATLTAIQQLGNFAIANFSQKIQPLIPEIKSLAACSTVSKDLSLYRLFLTDGRFVSIGFKDQKVTGITICDLSQPMNCAYAGETLGGAQFLVMGGTNGYVYQMDSGIQIDGAELNAFMRSAFHYSKMPSRQKRYRRAQLDVQAQGDCTLMYAPEYSFGAPAIQSDASRTLALVGGGGYWDVAQWDEFKWDNAASSAPTFKLEGSGLNISQVIAHSSSDEPPHTIQGVSLHKSLRRLDRGSST